MNLKRYRRLSLVITFFILLSQFTVYADKTEEVKTIHIRNAEDLRDFAQKASYDRFSENLTVILENDIDLQGEEFKPIPIFKGRFEGNNHTIKGMVVEGSGSKLAFIRYLEEGALLKDLNVEGAVTPTGDQEGVAGLVAQNQGTIENSSFSGLVKGKNTVGGLVAFNNPSGQIIKSSFSGMAYGNRKVGGIVGSNAGTILHSSNHASINTRLEEEDSFLQGLSDFKLSYSSIFTDATDIGGIAGANRGVIKSSRNHGQVGYPSVGYNVGGIVGRQSGHIANCENHGHILGRKDVGGIVGQIEPNIKLSLKDNKLEEIGGELSRLQSSIRGMRADMDASYGIIKEQLGQVDKDIEKSKGQISDLIDYGDSKLESIDWSKLEILDTVLDLGDNLESLSRIMTDQLAELAKSLDEIIDFIESETDVDEELEDLLDLFKEIRQDIESIEGYFENIKEDLGLIRKDLEDGDIEKALDRLKNLELQQLRESLQSMAKNIGNTLKELSELGDLLEDFDGLEELITSLTDMGQLLKDVIVEMEGLTNNLGILLKAMREIELPDFQAEEEFYYQSREELFSSLVNINSSLAAFAQESENQGKKLMDNMDKVMDLMFGLIEMSYQSIEDMVNQDLDDINLVEDLSQEDIDLIVEGKVLDSINHGPIEADLNVGGVAGAMSLDFEQDPEDDINIEGKKRLNTILQSRAVVDQCQNFGKIQGKKNNIGGIVGNMELGYLRGGVSSGQIESENGSYLGGIAGQSLATIDSSYVKSNLKGKEYLGGIVGYGKEIKSSYSLVEIEGHTYLGAIAGSLEEDHKLEKNYFVSDKLHGVDGISYHGQAQPISYEKLMDNKERSRIFKEFKVFFWAEDKIIKTMDFQYGQSLKEDQLPKIPEKDGYYGYWQDIDYSSLNFDQNIYASYQPYLNLLESKELREEVLPLLLVEGEFRQDEELEIQQIEDREEYKLTIPQDGYPGHLVRYIPEDKLGKAKIYVKENDRWKQVQHREDGKYLVFTSLGNQVHFKLERKIPLDIWAYISIGLISLFILIVGARFYAKRKNKQKI